MKELAAKERLYEPPSEFATKVGIYFPNLDEAKEVIRKMVKVARHLISRKIRIRTSQTWLVRMARTLIKCQILDTDWVN